MSRKLTYWNVEQMLDRMIDQASDRQIKALHSDNDPAYHQALGEQIALREALRQIKKAANGERSLLDQPEECLG